MKKKLPITAIFATAEIISFGLFRCMLDNKVSVPDDISIIGFDDLQICRYISPYLTTVKQNIKMKESIADETIIKEIEKRRNIDKTIIVPAEIVVRENVKKLKK